MKVRPLLTYLYSHITYHSSAGSVVREMNVKYRKWTIVLATVSTYELIQRDGTCLQSDYETVHSVPAAAVDQPTAELTTDSS